MAGNVWRYGGEEWNGVDNKLRCTKALERRGKEKLEPFMKTNSENVNTKDERYTKLDMIYRPLTIFMLLVWTLGGHLLSVSYLCQHKKKNKYG